MRENIVFYADFSTIPMGAGAVWNMMSERLERPNDDTLEK